MSRYQRMESIEFMIARCVMVGDMDGARYWASDLALERDGLLTSAELVASFSSRVDGA